MLRYISKAESEWQFLVVSVPHETGNVRWILARVTLLFWLHREENYLASVPIRCWKLHFQTPFVCMCSCTCYCEKQL